MNASRLNVVGKAIMILGIIDIVGGFILGFAYGKDLYGHFLFKAALIYWCAGIISGIMLFGFAEIIFLLQELSDKASAIYKLQNVSGAPAAPGYPGNPRPGVSPSFSAGGNGGPSAGAGTGWTCRHCGAFNAKGLFCVKCGKGMGG